MSETLLAKIHRIRPSLHAEITEHPSLTRLLGTIAADHPWADLFFTFLNSPAGQIIMTFLLSLLAPKV